MKKIMCCLCLMILFIGNSFVMRADARILLEQINNNLPDHSYFQEREIPLKWNGKELIVVYLKFDDGPSKLSEEFIEILQRYDVKATFFYIGSNVSRYPDTVKAVHEAGFYIGLHSMTHDRQIIYNPDTPEALTQELLQEQDLLEGIIGVRPTLFRPPYGSVPGITPAMADSLIEHDFKIWDWTIDSKDWKQKSANEILETIKKQTNAPVEIVLMHEKELTLEALANIIEFYRSQGYEFRMYDSNHHLINNFLKDNRL